MTDAVVDWSTISEARFNELTEALFVGEYEHNSMLIAQPVDGRGGDGGIDIAIRHRDSDELAEVIQLKWFREGMSGGFTKRREQVRASFQRAREHSPSPKWTLVIPGEGTNAEHEFVRALGAAHGVSTRMAGRAELNVMLSRQPLLQEWANRNLLRDAFGQLGRESKALARPGDATQELKRLHDRINSRSAYWGWDLSIGREGISGELYAKRSDAAEREPLSIQLTLSFDDHSRDLHDEFRDFQDFGGFSTVKLPGRVITSFVQSGPEWFADDHVPHEVELHPRYMKGGQRARIQVLDQAERVTSTVVGQVTRRSSPGAAGVKVEMSFPGGILMQWRFPKQGTAATTTVSHDPVGLSSTSVRRALDFLAALRSSSVAHVSIDDTVFTLTTAGELAEEIDVRIQELAEDLSVIERELDVELPFPELIPEAEERLRIRMIRLALDGLATIYPGINGFNATLNDVAGLPLRQLAETGGAILFREAMYGVEVLGHKLTLDEFAVTHPRVKLANAAQVLRALDEKRTDGVPLQLRSWEEDSTFRVYMPSRFRGEEVIPVPWGVTGLPDPKLD